jgi:ABC-type maltose transport system permease subunit
MAAGLMAAVPITVAYAFLSEYYIEGLTAGSIK